MKKLLFTLSFLLLISGLSKAQGLYSGFFIFMDEGNSQPAGTQYPNPDAKKNGIKQVEYMVYNEKKKKYELTTIYLYNAYGSYTGRKSYDKDGHFLGGAFYRFIDSIHYDRDYYYSSTDSTYDEYTFDEKFNVIKQVWVSGGKPTSTHLFTYNDKNQLVKMDYYWKKKKKYYQEYDYYDDGSEKEKRSYNAKGKLTYTWTYNSPTGNGQPDKQNRTVDFHKNRIYQPDSSFTVTYEVVDLKGKSIKWVDIYSKDSLKLESRDYTFKGELNATRIYKYDGQRRLIEIDYIVDGNTKYVYSCTFLENGMPATSRGIDSKGKDMYNYQYNYKYY